MPKIGSRRCAICKFHKSLDQFYNLKSGSKSKSGTCKSCQNLANKQSRSLWSVERRLLQSTKVTASTQNLPHGIEKSDILLPTHCPYLEIEIDYEAPGKSWNAPSVDKIVPSLGYVPGNIQVVSCMANRMKSNASISQLMTFAENVLRLHG